MRRTGTVELVSRRIPAPVYLAALAAFSLGASDPACQRSDQPSLGQSFVLKAGTTATLSDANVHVRFDAVLEDSRCPEGEQCVWAGNARVALKVGAEGGADTTVELNTNRGNREATVGDFRVTLEKVEPYPSAPRPIAPAEYRVTVSLHKV